MGISRYRHQPKSFAQKSRLDDNLRMLSCRARDNNAWFMKQFGRALNRQGSKDSSRIDLATAENWLIRPDLLELLRKNCWKNLESKHLSYATGLGGAPELLAAVSKFYNCFFAPSIPVEPEHLVVGPGCSSILDTLINDICDDGDGLLVAAPMWGSFEISAVLRNRVKIIPVQVPSGRSGSANEVVGAYRDAAEKSTCNVRGILFCNPHNPSGHICPVDIIDSLLQYCEQADFHFISDEIYALSSFGSIGTTANGNRTACEPVSSQFFSVLQRDLNGLGVRMARVHQIYSISKDFGSSGLRLGCLVTQDNKELRMSQSILNNAKICNVAAIMIIPILEDLSTLATLVNINKERLREAARVAIQFAEFHELEYIKPAAGLYVWVRLSAECTTWGEEEDCVQQCANRGVMVGSGADYAEFRPGWYRLTFAVPQLDLLAGLHRIEDAMGYSARFQPDSDFRSLSSWRLSKLLSSWVAPTFMGWKQRLKLLDTWVLAR
ncbi:pyridoxal phosphate-dependent transferase [Pyrenochaeta sp. MPI-SDFR-AT-0127]|nr:pyridoxal phosphate-dependent transferase [Pyrenochaeta sp. MPI-SDFR-AT-0127]